VDIKKLRRDDYVVLECKALAAEGMGLCHLPEGLGRGPSTGFVWGVLEGETFIARIAKTHSGVFFGILATRAELPEEILALNEEPVFVDEEFALLRKSPRRVVSDCSNFVHCGGCKLRHISYQDSLDVKRGWLQNHLRREKISHENIEIVPSPVTEQYRNHVQIHINKYRQRGFYAPFSYTTVPFPEEGCRLYPQKQADALFPEELSLERVVRIRHDARSGNFQFTAFNSPGDKTVRFAYHIEYPPGTVTTIEQSNTAFFQVNNHALPLWLKQIEQYFTVSLPERKGRVLELFSGSGFITRHLSYTFALDVVGIDTLKKSDATSAGYHNDQYGDAPSGKYFSDNYIQADLTNLSVLKEKDRLRIREFGPDILLLNPPRSGFAPSQSDILFEELIPSFTGNIVYSSCNGATLARDLPAFLKRGYSIAEMKILDFFPYTAHFEILVFLRKL